MWGFLIRLGSSLQSAQVSARDWEALEMNNGGVFIHSHLYLQTKYVKNFSSVLKTSPLERG